MPMNGFYAPRDINDRIISILRKEKLDDLDKDTISGLLTVMDSWKEYYPKADTSQIAYYEKLRNELSLLKNEDEKNKEKNEISIFEIELLGNGLSSYPALSGSNAYNYFVDKNTKSK